MKSVPGIEAGIGERARRELIWLARVRELPSFPPMVRQALAAVENNRSSARDIAIIINKDEAIAAKVLRLVNSPFYGLRGEVSTISRAVAVLGIEQIRTLLVGVAVFDNRRFRDPAAERNRKLLWEHALSSARWSEELAAITRYSPLDEASLAALLHDVGKIVFGVSDPEMFADSMALCRSDGITSCEAEDMLFGINHLETGKMASEHWRFPPLIRSVVMLHHCKWPPQIDRSSSDYQRLTHLLALVRVADEASKRYPIDFSCKQGVEQIGFAISPKELNSWANEVHALLDYVS